MPAASDGIALRTAASFSGSGREGSTTARMISAMSGLARPELLATTEWLAENLGHSAIRVLDLRWRPDGSAPDVHAAGHIPGAVLADGTTVVVYDDTQGLFASRAWWSLGAYGFDAVRILDGGYPDWVAEGREVSNARVPAASTGFTLRGPNRARLTTSDVRGLLGSPEVTLIDARAPAEYLGFEGNTKRLGHIPGAVNVPVGATSEPGHQRLRDGAALRDMLHRANVTRGRRMVCYDGSGIAAAKLAFVLTLLGHEDVAVYDGGWADWGNRLDLPVDR